MMPIHPITSSTTVNALAAELYNVIDAHSGTLSEPRRDGAAAALRRANPDLPADETSFDDTLVTFVRTPQIGRSPFRIPPYSSGLRDDLASINVRDIEQIFRVSLSLLMSELPGTPVEAQVERLRNICRIMRIRGMDRATAAALHDDSTNPLETPGDIAAASQATIKTILEDHVTGGFPAALLDNQPRIRWRAEARHLTAPKPSTPLNVAPQPWPAERSRTEALFWAKKARSTRRTAAQRESAEAISFLYKAHAALIAGNRLVTTGTPGAAIEALREAYRVVGRRAVERGVISPSSEQADGPSVQTIAQVCRIELAAASATDLARARSRAGVVQLRGSQGKRAFKVGDLSTTPADTVRQALNSHPLHVLGAEGERALAQALGERAKSSLGMPVAGLTIGIATQNSSARLVDLSTTDSEQSVQNQRVFSVQGIRDNEGGVWSETEQRFTLHDVSAAVSSSLTGTAKANLSSEVAAQFPDSLTTNMGPFDAFFTFEPLTSSQESARHIPLNTNFAARYREDVLESLAAVGRDDAWSVSEADLLDIGSFGFLLPMILGKLTPTAMAKCAGAAHAADLGIALIDFAARMGHDSVVFSRPISAVWSESGAMIIDPDTSTWSDNTTTWCIDSYRLNNHNGDIAYQHGDFDTAQRCYEEVLASARNGVGPHGDLARAYAGVRDDILARRAAGDRSARKNVWAQYGVEKDGEIHPILGERITSRPVQMVTKVELAMASRLEGADIGGPALWHPYYELMNIDDPSEQPPAPEPSTGGFGTAMLDAQKTYTIPGDPRSDAGTVAIHKLQAAILAEVLYAAFRLDSLAAGFNWLGFNATATPPWRYEHLVAQARYFCSKADDLQQRTFSLLLQAESAELSELSALHDAALAREQTEVARAAQDVADAQVAVAETSEEAARKAKNAAGWSAAFQVIGAAASMVMGAGAAVSAVKDASGLLNKIVAGSPGVSTAASGVGQIAQALSQVQQAKGNYEVAKAQTELSNQQATLTGAEAAVATMRSDHAKEMLKQLASRQGTSENLFALKQAVLGIGSDYLIAANRLAWLAERAFLMETRRVQAYIAQNYVGEGFDQRFSGAARLHRDLDEMEHVRLSSADRRPQLIKATISLREFDPTNLVMLRETGACLFRVDQRSIDERFPGLFLHAIRRVEVEIDGLIPATGVSGVLSTPGSSLVRVPNTPTYVATHALVGHDWVYPQGPTSEAPYQLTFQPAQAPPYVMKPVYGKGATQILSEYRRAADSVVLGLPEGALDIFEHHGVDVLWSLSIPRAGNTLDFARIVDVRFVLYFTALFDQTLADDQQRMLSRGEHDEEVEDLYDDIWIDRGVMLSAAARALEPLPRGLPDRTDRVDLRLIPFPISSDDLPSDVKERAIADFAVSLFQIARRPITLWVRSSATPKGAVVTIPYSVPAEMLDGQAFTALSDFGFSVDIGEDTVEHVPRTGTFPTLEALLTGVTDPEDPDNHDNILGDWSVKILVDDNADLRLRDDDGAIALTDGGQVEIDAGGSMVHDEVDHANVRVRLRARIGAGGPVSVWARDDGVGDGVRLVLDTTGGVTLTDGTASTTAVDALHADVWTDVDLLVFDTTAVARLDGVEVARLEIVAASAAGTVAVRAGTGAAATVSEVRVTRLRYTGLELEDLVDDTFATGADGWTLDDATWEPVSRAHLDLSFLIDVHLFVSYRGRLAISE